MTNLRGKLRLGSKSPSSESSPTSLPSPPPWKGGGGILFYLCPFVRPKMFITFFSVIIYGSNLIFDHRLQKGQSKVANPLRCPWSSSVDVPSLWRIWVICRQILGCGHPSRSSTAGITSWSMLTGCLLPKSELIFICCWCLSLHRMGLRLSIDITEEGSDVGDDSDDGDFEPSLNFTLRFVMLISCFSCNLHTCTWNFVLITEPRNKWNGLDSRQ
jgi:hypothetical protein